jgi:hypothetical protein
MYHERWKLFKLEHLDRYSIVKEPCTIIVKTIPDLLWTISTQKIVALGGS